jgi:hypothetical protein
MGGSVAEFLDMGQSRTLSWARRPQAAALLAAIADPNRGFDAIMIGEGTRYRRIARRRGKAKALAALGNTQQLDRAREPGSRPGGRQSGSR